MKLAALLLMFLPFYLQSQTSDIACFQYEGDEIQFEEMRSDTLVMWGSNNAYWHGEHIIYRWVLWEGNEIVEIYIAKPDHPYFLAPIKPGMYSLVRMTDHYDQGVQTGTTISNTVSFEYKIPTVYQSE